MRRICKDSDRLSEITSDHLGDDEHKRHAGCTAELHFGFASLFLVFLSDDFEIQGRSEAPGSDRGR